MFDEIAELLRQGGPCAYAIVAVGVILYALLILRGRALFCGATHSTSDSRLSTPHSAGRTPHNLHLIRALIAVAPLLGLLGTVNGMIHTFDSLNTAGASANRIGTGVSEALITTQLGLTVAAPALLIECMLSRRMKRMRAADREATR